MAEVENISELPPLPNNQRTRQTSPRGYTFEQHVNTMKRLDAGSTKLKRQTRVENKSSLKKLNLDEMEMMRQETKLVVLEYLSSLPPEQIKARNRSSTGSILKTKSKTIHASVQPFVDVIGKRKQSGKGKLLRRNSEQYDQRLREKFRSMADPLRKSISPEILSEIAQFNKDKLRGGRRRCSSLHLTLRSGVVPENGYPDSPMTCVTSRLEEMSEDIMKDYPQLLDEHLSELLTPLDLGEKLTYEDFASVAKTVFEKQLARFTGSVWSKVALVFYLVKEVIFSAGLNDFQVELLVDYATRFISEHSLDPIRKEGGWVALEFQDGPLIGSQELSGDIYNPLRNSKDFDDQVDGPAFNNGSTDNLSEEELGSFSYLGSVKDIVKGWTSYGAAALAVGIGVAYSYLKQQS